MPGYALKTFVVDILAANDGPLAVSALIDAARWFGFSEGALRVCLSRLTRRKLLEASEVGGRSCYGFTRGAASVNRAVRDRVWFDRRRRFSGRWLLVVLTGESAGRAAREEAARRLRALHLRPIAPAVWARPDNISLSLPPVLDAYRAAGGRAEVFTASPAGATSLAARVPKLWDVERLGSRLAACLVELEASRARVETLAYEEALVESLRVGAAAFRLVASDPLLPLETLPRDWPGERLRNAVVEYNHLGCDLWAGVAFGRPARNPRPRRPRSR